MSRDDKHEQLVLALRALAPDELEALLRKTRSGFDQQRTLGAAPTVGIGNCGEHAVRLRFAGQATHSLAPGERVEIAIHALPLPQRLVGGASAQSQGFDLAPVGLASGQIDSDHAKYGGTVNIDLRAWHKHAARFGLPHGYVHGAVPAEAGDSQFQGAPWRALDSALSEWRFGAGGSLELVVLGVGLDLSGLTLQFADLLKTGRDQETLK